MITLIDAHDMIRYLLPLAKGYVAANPGIRSTETIIEDAEAMIAAAPANPVVPDGWQPIETAPRSNGSETFLAYVPGHGPVVAYKLDSGAVFNASKPLRNQPPILRATHWMPLPAALQQCLDVELLDPDMPAQELRLHMGELTAQEMLVARAAIRWANTKQPRPDVVEVPREVLLQVYGAVGPYYPSENMLTSPLNDAARALQPYVTEGK